MIRESWLEKRWPRCILNDFSRNFIKKRVGYGLLPTYAILLNVGAKLNYMLSVRLLLILVDLLYSKPTFGILARELNRKIQKIFEKSLVT